jgi:predicted amidophosphoribosyltransferase
MLKENGRLKPADKEEMASIVKGKTMLCSSCGKEFSVLNAQFGDTVCEKCGEKLMESDMAFAGKITGK